MEKITGILHHHDEEIHIRSEDNRLEHTCLAVVNDSFKHPAKYAAEITRRWNSYDKLLDACKVILRDDMSEILQYCIDHRLDYEGIYTKSSMNKLILKAAIAGAEKGTE